MKKLITLLLAAILLLGCLALTGCESEEEKALNAIHTKLEGTEKLFGKVSAVYRMYPDGDYNITQGACTDGKYIYMLLENQNENGGGKDVDHHCKVVKIDAATMKEVARSEPLAIDHGNDITYNSKTKQLVVIHNQPNRDKISFVDPEKLVLLDTISHSELQMYAIAYNAEKDQYVIGLSFGYDFAIVDSEFNVIQKHTGVVTGYTKQNFDWDGKYIYMLQFKENCAVIYDWDGNHIRTVMIEMTEEPEAIFHIGGQFYVTSYISGRKGGRIYKLDLKLESEREDLWLEPGKK